MSGLEKISDSCAAQLKAKNRPEDDGFARLALSRRVGFSSGWRNTITLCCIVKAMSWFTGSIAWTARTAQLGTSAAMQIFGLFLPKRLGGSPLTVRAKSVAGSWNVAAQAQGDHPPEGEWVSKKGNKSYVYSLIYPGQKP